MFVGERHQRLRVARPAPLRPGQALALLLGEKLLQDLLDVSLRPRIQVLELGGQRPVLGKIIPEATSDRPFVVAPSLTAPRLVHEALAIVPLALIQLVAERLGLLPDPFLLTKLADQLQARCLVRSAQHALAILLVEAAKPLVVTVERVLQARLPG